MSRLYIFAGGLRRRMARWLRWAVILWFLWYAFGVYQRHSAWCRYAPLTSPDGQYSLHLCSIRGSGMEGTYVARLYDNERRELVFEREIPGIDLSGGITWGAGVVIWTVGEYGAADLPPTWLTRFRAKLP